MNTFGCHLCRALAGSDITLNSRFNSERELSYSRIINACASNSKTWPAERIYRNCNCSCNPRPPWRMSLTISFTAQVFGCF